MCPILSQLIPVLAVTRFHPSINFNITLISTSMSPKCTLSSTFAYHEFRVRYTMELLTPNSNFNEVERLNKFRNIRLLFMWNTKCTKGPKFHYLNYARVSSQVYSKFVPVMFEGSMWPNNNLKATIVSVDLRKLTY
jgi:hypothetical protein